MNPVESHIRVACYVRKSSVVAPVDATISQLDQLEVEGIIDDVTVDVWPAEVRLADGPPYSDIVALVETLDAWAEQWAVSIRPPFAVETRHSEITGETRDVLITPIQCLAISINGALVEVFPHTTDRAGDSQTYTVADALRLLEAHDSQALGPAQTPDTPPSQHPPATLQPSTHGACPACDASLVTGQGVYACSNCPWTGVAAGLNRYRALTTPAIRRPPAVPHPEGDSRTRLLEASR